MAQQLGRIAIIANLPGDLRAALAERFELLDLPLEGADTVELNSLPTDIEIVATRPLLGVPDGLLDQLPHLRLVLSMGAGLELIEQDELEERGVQLVYTPDEFTEDVADFALGLIYAAQRNIVTGDRFVRDGAWAKERFRTARRVSNRRIGIVGLGRIGRRVAEKCAALGMDVGYYSRRRYEDADYEYMSSVAQLAERSDILVLACAQSDETYHLVDAEILQKLGPEGILVNVARGSVVDEDALFDALANERIAAAALDVFAKEPGLDPRFCEYDNVILSPHAASFTIEARAAVISRLVNAAKDYAVSGAAAPQELAGD